MPESEVRYAALACSIKNRAKATAPSAVLARAASGTIDTSAELELEAVEGVDTGDDKESDGVWAGED
jgi:hypothetical protein